MRYLNNKVLRKYCVFFTIHCDPSLAYIAVRDLQSFQRNSSVQSLLLAGIFFVQPIAECWRGRGGKLSRILLKKHTIFNEHPVLYEQQHLSLSVDVWPEENEPAGVPAHLPVLAADGARSKHVYYPH